MECEQWSDILSTINEQEDLSKVNVIEKIKEKLEKEDPGTYKEWQDNKFDINYTLNGELTLLCIAVIGCLAKVTELLIKKGADVNKVSLETAPLSWAARNSRTDIVNILVEQGAKVNNTDNSGMAPLHLAAQSGHTETVNALVKAGADVNARSEIGVAPLHLAAQSGHTETVNALVKAGADVNAVTNRFGATPLRRAAKNGYTEIINILLAAEADINAGVEHSFIDVINTMLAREVGVNEVEVNAENWYRKTPLRRAIINNHKEAAKLLITHEIKLGGSEAQKPSYLEQPNSDLKREMSEYWDECLDEVKRMKEEKIYKAITFYDILISKNNKLASHIRKKDVEKVLEEGNYKSKFPIYGDKIESQFKIGKQRLDALNIGEMVIAHFDGFMRESCPFNLEIAEYLSNEDIKNLRKAVIQTIDEYDMNTKVTDVSLSQPFASKRFS